MKKPFSAFVLLPGILAFAIFTKGQGIIIPQNAYLIQQNGNLVTHSQWTNNGTFIHNGGTLVFAGTIQVLQGSSQPVFNNITVRSTSTTTITASGQKIRGILLCNGTLNANDNLTLLSTASQTALVDGSGTGSILGHLTMQRYLPKGYGYKYFSSPFQDAKVSEFADDMNLRDTLYPSSPDYTFSNFYRYDENRTMSGWIRYDYPDSLLKQMEGYAVNVGAEMDPKTMDVKGTVNNGPFSRTLYNHDSLYTQGFNLLGNPYPSPINWDAASGWTKTNIDNALYYFNAGDTDRYRGTYSSYINGISSDGIANGIIPSMQGCFVHVTDGPYPVTGTLGVTNDVRINDLSPVFHKSVTADPPPLIRLTANFPDFRAPADPTVIYFTDSSSVAFEKNQDALKLLNTDDFVPNLYCLSPDNRRISINALPLPDDSITVIPLGLTTRLKGWVVFRLQDVERMPYYPYLYFNDSACNSMQDLREKPEFRAYLEPGDYEGRYSLVISKTNLRYFPDPNHPFFAYSSGCRIYVHFPVPENEKCDLAVYNMLGQLIQRETISGNGYHTLDIHTNDGYYLVSLCASKKVYSQKVYINNQW